MLQHLQPIRCQIVVKLLHEDTEESTWHSFLYRSKDLEMPQTMPTGVPSSSHPGIQVTSLSQKGNKQAATSILPDFMSLSDKWCRYAVLNPEKVCVENSNAGRVDPVSHDTVLACGMYSTYGHIPHMKLNIWPPSGYSCTPLFLSFAEIIGLL